MDLQKIAAVVKRLEETQRSIIAAQHEEAMLQEELRSLVNGSENKEVTNGLRYENGNRMIFTNLTGLTVRDRVLELFAALPENSFGVEEIAKRTDATEPYIRTLLSNMLKDGEIERKDRGQYGARTDLNLKGF